MYRYTCCYYSCVVAYLSAFIALIPPPHLPHPSSLHHCLCPPHPHPRPNTLLCFPSLSFPHSYITKELMIVLKTHFPSLDLDHMGITGSLLCALIWLDYLTGLLERGLIWLDLDHMGITCHLCFYGTLQSLSFTVLILLYHHLLTPSYYTLYNNIYKHRSFYGWSWCSYHSSITTLSHPLLLS